MTDLLPYLFQVHVALLATEIGSTLAQLRKGFWLGIGGGPIQYVTYPLFALVTFNMGLICAMGGFWPGVVYFTVQALGTLWIWWKRQGPRRKKQVEKMAGVVRVIAGRLRIVHPNASPA